MASPSSGRGVRDVRSDRFPLTYDECRERFRWTARLAGVAMSHRTIDARGVHGQELTIDVAWLGSTHPTRALVVLGGVHGDEGFSSSVLQCEAIDRWTSGDSAWHGDGVGVVLVHGVNPWGMAMWRRQNESNVDLNRNWNRDQRVPPMNARYRELHDALCPAGAAVPDSESFLARTRELIDEHGYAWVKAAVTEGQYTHPDGLYFGGDRTEQSTSLLAEIVAERLRDALDVLVVDLHTGHGERGASTLLSDAAAGSEDDGWLRQVFDGERIETIGTSGATSSPKSGQLSTGLAEVVPGARWRAVTMELGTCSDTRMILAERAEHWVHCHGDRTRREHAEIVWNHRCCSTPDDVGWEAAARQHGQRILDAAFRALIVP